jgi:LCP family protein required for cell wall assembly
MHVSPLKALVRVGAPAQIQNKTNILLLGIGGGDHDGPNLSDSITILSYDQASNTIRTLGVPRDVWSEALQEKINAAYAIGEAIKPGHGLTLASAELSSLTGVPIHYAVVVAFDGFEQIIDYVGGVDVVVENAFTDHEYPIAGRENDTCGGHDPDYKCRYETIHFDKGTQHMDGKVALKFVRSRHAVGDEGSDFARSKRQQLVMSALRRKILAASFMKDTKKIAGLYALLDRMVIRNMSNQTAAVLARDILFGGKLQQESNALKDNLFDVPSPYVYGKYVLVPKDTSGDGIRRYVRKYFDIQL